MYIPSSVEEVSTWGCYHQNTDWFYDVEVSPDNEFYSSVDGNLTSKDKKTLIYAKVSKDGFTVPDGIEVIEKHSLFSTKGVRTIPASVREINYSLYGTTICTTSGTYAEAYAKKNKAKLIVDGVL